MSFSFSILRVYLVILFLILSWFSVTDTTVRTQTGQIFINEFVGNPDCLTPDNLEWVELFNPSNTDSVDLTGWVLRDNTQSPSNRKILNKKNTVVYDAQGNVVSDSLLVPPLGYAVFKTPEGWLNNQNTGQEGLFLYKSVNDAKNNINLVDKITFGTADSDIPDYPVADQVIARIPDGGKPVLKPKTKFQNYNTLGRSNSAEPEGPRACGKELPPKQVTVEIDFNYLYPKKDGKICGLGAALENDGLKLTISNWQDGYQVQRREAIGDQSFGAWENITTLPGSSLQVSNSTAIYLYPNTTNTPAGLRKLQIRVVDSSGQVLAQTSEYTYQVVDEPNNFVCGGNQEIPKPEKLKIGFLTKEILAGTATPDMLGELSVYGSYCGVTTKDRSVQLEANKRASWIASRWTKIPGANSYRVTDYLVTPGGLMQLAQYDPKSLADTDSKVTYTESDNYVEFTAFWLSRGGFYFRQVEALDAKQEVLAKNSFEDSCLAQVYIVLTSLPFVDIHIEDPLNCRGVLSGQVTSVDADLKEVYIRLQSTTGQVILERKMLVTEEQKRNFVYSFELAPYLKEGESYQLQVIAKGIYKDEQDQWQEIVAEYEDVVVYQKCKENIAYKRTGIRGFQTTEEKTESKQQSSENSPKVTENLKTSNNLSAGNLASGSFSEQEKERASNSSTSSAAKTKVLATKLFEEESEVETTKKALIRTGGQKEQKNIWLACLLCFFGLGLILTNFGNRKKAPKAPSILT